VREEQAGLKDKKLVALDRKSPPFAKDAKDGAPSSSFVMCRNVRKVQEGGVKPPLHPEQTQIEVLGEAEGVSDA